MRTMTRSILGLFLLLPAALFSQTGAIRGQVTDARSGELLVGARVVIVDTKPGKGAATDVNGMFLVQKLPSGEYTVRVMYVDYQTFTLSGVKVSAGETTEISVAMRKEGDPEPATKKTADSLIVHQARAQGVPDDSLVHTAGKQESEEPAK